VQELNFHCLPRRALGRSSPRHELVQLAFSHGASTRLRNSLLAGQDEGALDGITVEAVLTGAPTAIAMLQNLPNFGAKSMTELGLLVRKASSMSSSDNGVNMGANFGCRPARISEQSEISIASLLDSLQHVDARSRQVVEARLGLLEDEQQTLAEVGATLGLTRERVRQIESKALKQLRRMFGNTFSRMLKDREASTLAGLATNSVIPDTDEGVLFASLPPEVRFLVRTLYNNSRTWLDTVATRIENGWLLEGLPMDSYLEAKQFLANRLDEVRLPCQLSNVLRAQGDFSDAVVEIIRLEKTLKVLDGYVLPRRSTRRPRRAIRIHKLMLRREFADPIGLAELKETYLRQHLDDQCGARDLMIVLSANPQLFLNQYELGWLPFGARQEVARPANFSIEEGAAAPDEIAIDEDEAMDDDVDTLRSTLAQILLTNGPQSFNDLRRIFVSQVGGKYSKASVGPILISYDEFVRIGPGIYAHRRQLHDSKLLNEVTSRLLLNKAQCELFCRAVWAGESPLSYLLWSPIVQVEWAEWCYISGQEKLLASLLAVCTVHEWPIKAGDRSRWLRLQERLSFYSLEEPPLNLTERLPSFREFLAAAAYAVRTGRVSWMSANRVNGYRVEDRHAVSILALLVAARIVEPAMHWQHEHQATERGEIFLRPFFTSSEHQPHTKWPMKLIRSMRTRYDSLLEPGWTTGESICALLDAIQQDALRDDEADTVVLTASAKYEQLKKQLKNEIILDNLRLRLAMRNKE
jgi:hypothetical protein